MNPTRLLVGVSGVVLAAATACTSSSGNPPSVTTTPVVTVPASTPVPSTSPLPRGVLASIAMSGGPLRMASGYGDLWVASHDGNTLFRVDPGSNAVVARINVGTEVCGTPAIGLGRVWVSGCGPGPLVSVDPKTNRVVKQANYPSSLEMTTAAGKIWASDPLDPVTMRRTAHVDAAAEEVVAGAGSLWFLETETGLVKRVDPTTASITRTYRAGDPTALETFGVFASGALLVYSGEDRLWQIDAATNHVTSRTLKGIAGAGATFTVGDGAVWVRPNDGNLYRFDQSTFDRTTYPADTSSGGFVTVAFGSVWESNIDDDSLWRVRE